MRNLFITDPLATIDVASDTSSLLMMTGLDLGQEIWLATPEDLLQKKEGLFASAMKVKSVSDETGYELDAAEDLMILDGFDVVWLRKDPPFDTKYILHLALFDQLVDTKILFVNQPSSVRELNEKLSIFWFPEYAPETIVTGTLSKVKEFWQQHGDIVVKSLIGFGGDSVERIENWEDSETDVTTMLANGYIMAQPFLPEVYDGDLRVYLVNGKIIGSLLRVPQTSFRGNLHAGGRADVGKPNAKQEKIALEVAQFLKSKGVFFAGIDFVGDYLTEINVTSPGVIREANAVSGMRLDKIIWNEILQLKNDAK